MADVKYSLWVGVQKALKNGLVVMAPAFVAGWLAFITNVPDPYKTLVAAVGGFLGYLLKNWIENK